MGLVLNLRGTRKILIGDDITLEFVTDRHKNIVANITAPKEINIRRVGGQHGITGTGDEANNGRRGSEVIKAEPKRNS